MLAKYIPSIYISNFICPQSNLANVDQIYWKNIILKPTHLFQLLLYFSIDLVNVIQVWLRTNLIRHVNKDGGSMLLELEETENINDVFTDDTIVYGQCKQCNALAVIKKK